MIILVGLVLTLSSCVTTKINTAESFWLWFEDNSEKFYNADISSLEWIMNQIHYNLKQVDERLIFEISVTEEGQRELLITANKDVELFDLVDNFCSIKPQLENWNIYSLRPRQELTETVYMHNDLSINLDKITFLFFEAEGNKVGIMYLIEDATDANIFLYTSAINKLTEVLVGERDHGNYVGQIIIDNTESKYMPYTNKISLLVNHFDKMVTELNQR